MRRQIHPLLPQVKDLWLDKKIWGGMLEQADKSDLKSTGSNTVRVQILYTPQITNNSAKKTKKELQKMPRKPQVTRTITRTRAVIMCLNTSSGETFTQEITFPHVFKDEREILHVAEKLLNTEGVKAVHVVSSEAEKLLYGMDIEEFYAHASILPPRNASETDNQNN